MDIKIRNLIQDMKIQEIKNEILLYKAAELIHELDELAGSENPRAGKFTGTLCSFSEKYMNLEAQRGVGGAKIGQYFFRDGQIVWLRLVNNQSYPIEIRLSDKHVSEEHFHEIKRDVRDVIVLQPSEEQYVYLGPVKVHDKGRSEEILRLQAIRYEEILIRYDSYLMRADGVCQMMPDNNKAWEEQNIIATLNIEYLVVR